IDVALLYPCDPIEPLIGGVESFIKGVIYNAPDNIRYWIVGATTDPQTRPVGKWSECRLGDKVFNYFPLYSVSDRGKRSRIPATVLFEVFALLRMPDLSFADVIESHRIEHLLIRYKDKPFSLFLHQNMAVLNNAKSDILWSAAPKLYRYLEKRLFMRPGNVFCVREDAVGDYRRIFPDKAKKFHFQPTWMDEMIFYPVPIEERQESRLSIAAEYGFDRSLPLAVAVGRIDSQKDPLLMVDAVAEANVNNVDIQVLWIGDGVLKNSMLNRIKMRNLESRFKLAGLKDAAYVADAMRAADFFLMSSAYEGMPIAVLESLACGCPVVSTGVGEVPRLIKDGENGFLARPGDISSLRKAIGRMVELRDKCAGSPCLEVAKDYRASNVLQKVYNSYF
ncbi:MAG: glycosyltransferase, partial [Gammaproteobacteria bacterium]